MKQERKYSATQLWNALSYSRHNIKGDGHIFTEDDIMTLVYGWVRHPKYPSPCSSVIYTRKQQHGEIWLSKEEIPSFESYVGYELLKYLD